MANDDLLREYAERVGALDELDASRGWGVMVDKLRHDSEAIRRDVLNGKLSPEDYRFKCGWLAGALHAVNVPALVRKEYERLLGQE